ERARKRSESQSRPESVVARRRRRPGGRATHGRHASCRRSHRTSFAPLHHADCSRCLKYNPHHAVQTMMRAVTVLLLCAIGAGGGVRAQTRTADDDAIRALLTAIEQAV